MNNNVWLEVKSSNNIAAAVQDAVFPEIGLPHKTEQSDDDFILIGYFTSFEDRFSRVNLLDEVKKWGFKRVTNSNSLFLLFFFDKRKQRLRVAVDQFLSFSCYFSIFENKVVFSSAFGPIKNELGKTQALRIDTDFLLSHLLWEWPNNDHTLIGQIKMIPGGCQASFDLKDLRLESIQTLMDIDAFYDSIRPRNYASLEQFSADWLSLLTEVVERRASQIPKSFKIGCDISSGFDCTLVSYCLSKILPHGDFSGFSNHSKIMGDENSPEVVKRFSLKHNIPLKQFDYTDHTLHLNNLDQNWLVDQAVNPFIYVHHKQYINFLNENGVRILFTGEYGDEAYDMKNMELFSRFPVQRGFFDSIVTLKRRKKEDFFTKNSQGLFSDQQRFKERGYYPLIVPSKSASCYLPVVEAYGSQGINRIHPFSDTRILALSHEAPLPIGVEPDRTKELIMPDFKTIMPENYISISNAGEPFLQMFINQKFFVKEVLSKSVLGSMGIIDPGLITGYINDPKSDLYNDKTYQRAMQLYPIIYLDWYLQRNNIG
ncbi:hypothetical protein HYU91_03375 [Candidatus Collierbacteria bacterium]|nr:hypothetical protein [Candidatus Collierbacteria bacterium]